MYSTEKKTNFKISYAELSMLSHQSYDTIMRDITEFEHFGISSNEVEALKSQAEELDNTPKDEELQGVVMDITISKNEIAEQVRMLIRKSTTFIKLVYNPSTGVYKSLDVESLSRKNDYELYNTAFGVVRISRLKADDFSPNLQDVATELEAAANQLLQKKKERHFAIQNRDIATQARVELANSLYSKLSKLTSLGREIWIEQDEAKYNDYVIYGSSQKKPDNSPPNSEDQDQEELPNG